MWRNSLDNNYFSCFLLFRFVSFSTLLRLGHAVRRRRLHIYRGRFGGVHRRRRRCRCCSDGNCCCFRFRRGCICRCWCCFGGWRLSLVLRSAVIAFRLRSQTRFLRFFVVRNVNCISWRRRHGKYGVGLLARGGFWLRSHHIFSPSGSLSIIRFIAICILGIQIVVRSGRFAFSAAEVKAAAKAATTEITASYASAEYKEHFAPRTSKSEVGVDVVVSKLLGYVETEASIFVINLSFLLVTQRWIGVVYFAKLFSCAGIVGVFVGVMTESELSVRLLDFFGRRVFGEIK